jgi:hypothetical protein
MKKALLLLLTSFMFVQLQAQNSGFYGHKGYVEVNGMGCWPLLARSGWFGETYDGTLRTKKDEFNSGFNIGAGYAVKRNLMIGLETGLWSFNVAGPEYLYVYDAFGYSYGMSIRHEMLDVRTFSVMPTFTFGGKKGLLPVGLNHQVGVGYTNTKVLKKDYKYRSGDNSYTQEQLDNMNEENGGFVDYKNNYTGFTAAYTLKVRIPVSKSVMINYGLRYTLNLTSQNTKSAGDGKMASEDLYREIRAARFRSVITFNLGITLAI